jgi:hypothetical protein
MEAPTQAQEYRAQAAECDRLAAISTSADVRVAYEEMAKDWRRMADRAERGMRARGD